MEMRNGGEVESSIVTDCNTNSKIKNKLSSLWGSSVSVSSHQAFQMADNFINNNHPYCLPFIDDQDQHQQLQHPPLNPSPVYSPTPLVNALNQLNLSNNHYSPSPPPPSPLIDYRPLIDNPYLFECFNQKKLMEMEMMTQGLKYGGFDHASSYSSFNNSHLLNHPYSKYFNGYNGNSSCSCHACQRNWFYPNGNGSSSYHTCQRNWFYPKDLHLSNTNTGRYKREDEYDYFNISRLQQLSINSPQFSMLTNTPKFTSWEEVRGSIVLLAKDQHGCRFLQKKIEGGRKEDIDMIFSEIKDAISDLMVDQFGNYLVQKLIDMCNVDQRNDILVTLTRRERVLLKICCDMHGTRAIQKLLERLSNEQQQARFISALTPGTVVLMTDINGHHVIQYCVEHFPIGLKMYLFDVAAAHCVEIAMDRSGCCVLQLCVKHSHGEIRERLVAEITNNALVLAQDPYGNYVVQNLMDLKKPQYTARLLRKLEGGFILLSMQKCSSNVVQRCLIESEDQAAQIVKELTSHPDILKLFHDAYGNYVIQTALAVTYKTRAYYSLVEMAKKYDTSLRNHPYGKRILSKIDQLSK